MIVGVIALAIGLHPVKRTRVRVLVLLLIPFTFLVALVWPYYPFLLLFREGSPEFAFESRVLYEDVLRRIFPALAALPLLILRFRRNWRDPLGWMFLGLTAIYLFGWLSQNWGYGRVIGYIMLVLQFVLADRFAELLNRWEVKPHFQFLLLGALALAVLVLMLLPDSTYRGLQSDLTRRSAPSAPYAFLGKYIGQYQVVMTDLATSWIVPTYGGKVIASMHPVYFVPNYIEREQDLERFFDSATSEAERRALLDKYSVDFILLRARPPQTPLDRFAPLGRIIHTNDRFVLMQVLR